MTRRQKELTVSSRGTACVNASSTRCSMHQRDWSSKSKQVVIKDKAKERKVIQGQQQGTSMHEHMRTRCSVRCRGYGMGLGMGMAWIWVWVCHGCGMGVAWV